MRFAVVIPVYNHARYVGKALESILGQTRKPNRVIAIDDGSPDDSLAVCRQFESRGVEVLGQENRGAHATINRLIDMASKDCDVISILNSDDHYALDRFEKCLPQLENDSQAQVVSSGLRLIDDEDQPLSMENGRFRWLEAVWSRRSDPSLELAEWMGEANFVVTTSNVIARREFFAAHPFKPYRFNHDYYFLCQAVLRGQLRVVDDRLLNYRAHASNTINTSSAPLLKELLLQWMELYRDLAPELARDEAMRQRFYHFTRASWDNVSGHPHGLMQVLMAQLLSQKTDAAALTSMIQEMTETQWPELSYPPNRALTNAWDGSAPLHDQRGLCQKNESLRAERDQARCQLKANRELAALRHQLLKSRWVALGRALGLGKDWTCSGGKTPEEKLTALQSAVRQSSWLRWGGIKIEDS